MRRVWITTKNERIFKGRRALLTEATRTMIGRNLAKIDGNEMQEDSSDVGGKGVKDVAQG